VPAMANIARLLSFSIQFKIVWGYALFIFFTIGGNDLASKLPRRLNSIATIEESHASKGSSRGREA
jgi:hypothetical protein